MEEPGCRGVQISHLCRALHEQLQEFVPLQVQPRVVVVQVVKGRTDGRHRFKVLDVTQLLKHMLPLAHSGSSWSLCCLRFERREPLPEQHRAELDEPAMQLGDDAAYCSTLISRTVRPHGAHPGTAARAVHGISKRSVYERRWDACDPGVTRNDARLSCVSSFRKISSGKWSRRWDSNPRPADYESAALPTELRRLEGVIGARSVARQTRHFSTAPPARGARSSNLPGRIKSRSTQPKKLLTSRPPVERKPKKLLNF
jgi:hypothetical protein